MIPIFHNFEQLTVSCDRIEKTLAKSVENPGDKQLWAINPNLSWLKKKTQNQKNTIWTIRTWQIYHLKVFFPHKYYSIIHFKKHIKQKGKKFSVERILTSLMQTTSSPRLGFHDGIFNRYDYKHIKLVIVIFFIFSYLITFFEYTDYFLFFLFFFNILIIQLRQIFISFPFKSHFSCVVWNLLLAQVNIS